MTALTLHLPDDQHERLRTQKGAGKTARGLDLLDKAASK